MGRFENKRVASRRILFPPGLSRSDNFAPFAEGNQPKVRGLMRIFLPFMYHKWIGRYSIGGYFHSLSNLSVAVFSVPQPQQLGIENLYERKT